MCVCVCVGGGGGGGGGLSQRQGQFIIFGVPRNFEIFHDRLARKKILRKSHYGLKFGGMM